MYQLIALLALSASLITAAPQSYGGSSAFRGAGGGGPFIPITRDDRNGPLNGNYDFAFETGNGIRRQEQGAPTGPKGAVESQGSWSFTFPDGTPGQFNFVADEFGYRVESPLLPTPPPMPAHALEQIAHAERERAAGIFHDGQYDHSRYGGSQASSSGVRPQGGRRQSYN